MASLSGSDIIDIIYSGFLTKEQEEKKRKMAEAQMAEIDGIKAKDLYERINAILAPKFIHYNDIAYVTAMSLAAKKNFWLFGEGGYGKSDMVETIFQGLGLMEKTYIQSFGQGMTPEKLVGNLDMRCLNLEHVIRFNVNESFMAYDYAIFEEMPDAAVTVLFLLKDTLARKKFRDGYQQFDMATKTIGVLSNRSPKAVAEYGVDAAALTQRFPYRACITWPTHKTEDYEALFRKREALLKGPELSGNTRAALSKILADANSKGETIPPRIALDAASAIKAAASMRGVSIVATQDFTALRHVAGLETLGNDIQSQIDDAVAKADALTRMKEIEAEMESIRSITKETPIAALQVVKKLQKFLNERVTPLKVTDDLIDRKRKVVETIGTAIKANHDKALELTNV